MSAVGDLLASVPCRVQHVPPSVTFVMTWTAHEHVLCGVLAVEGKEVATFHDVERAALVEQACTFLQQDHPDEARAIRRSFAGLHSGA